MYFSYFLSTIWQKKSNCLAALLFLLCSAPWTAAQVGGIDTDPGSGMGGKNTIQGNVYYSSGRRLDKRAKVRLRSLAAGELFTMTDDNGAFSFRRLRGGSYTVIVDAGEDFEMASENVEIVEIARRRDDSGQTISVQLMLQPKKSVPRAVGTVSAKTAGVAEEAKQLYKDALESSNLGDSKKAIEQLNNALKIQPDYQAALNELGVQYMRLKENAKSEEAFQRALKIDPEAFTPRLNYGVLLVQMQNYPKAVDELYKALHKDPTSAVGHLYIGRALVKLGSYDDAEKFLRLAVKYGKDEAIEAHRYLGAIYIEKHDNERATQELETYLRLSPNSKDAKAIGDIIKQLRAASTKK
jgi:Tfp pilus assembly protein PilF